MIAYVNTLIYDKNIVIPSGVPPAQNPRSSAQGSWTMCVVSVHDFYFFVEWVEFLFVLFLFMCLLLFSIFSQNGWICFVNYENGPTFVEQLMKIVSWRGLGEVLGALVVPLGLQMGPDSIFCDFV